MPIIKSAKKKMRQDKVRTARNSAIEAKLKKVIKKARKSKTKTTLREAFKALDIAAKKHLIHKNKAARLKSRLSI